MIAASLFLKHVVEIEPSKAKKAKQTSPVYGDRDRNALDVRPELRLRLASPSARPDTL